jgi:hypothetical protein
LRNLLFACLHVVGFPVDRCMAGLTACKNTLQVQFDRYFCCLKIFTNYLRRRSDRDHGNPPSIYNDAGGITMSPMVVLPERVVTHQAVPDYASLPTDEESGPVGMKL